MSELLNWTIDPFIAVMSLILGYVLGSIPFGLVLTRAAGLGDIRSIGSGNIGATNVLRTGNKKLAAATLLLDALKGTFAAIIASYWGMEAAMIAGFSAFIGHLFPLWLNFKGGKGVATYLGILLGLAPWMAVVFAVIWAGCAYLSRYSSASALLATLIVPVAEWFSGDHRISLVFLIMSIIVWIKHKANISRLVAGTESRIGDKG